MKKYLFIMILCWSLLSCMSKKEYEEEITLHAKNAYQIAMTSGTRDSSEIIEVQKLCRKYFKSLDYKKNDVHESIHSLCSDFGINLILNSDGSGGQIEDLSSGCFIPPMANPLKLR